MKRSYSRIELIVLFLFASLLMMFNAYPVISHAALVEFDILDETVCQGDVVEVLYRVYPDVEIGDHDKLQLRRGEIVVSEVDLDGMREGTVSLDTSSDNAPGEFAVVYVQCETGEVLGIADETVVVLSEAICILIEVAEELKEQATSVNRQHYIAEFISMLQGMPDEPGEYIRQNLKWSVLTIAFHIISETQRDDFTLLIDLDEEVYPSDPLVNIWNEFTTFNYGKPIVFTYVLKNIYRSVQQYAPPDRNELDEWIIEAIRDIVSTINEIVQVDAIRVMSVIDRIGPVQIHPWYVQLGYPSDCWAALPGISRPYDKECLPGAPAPLGPYGILTSECVECTAVEIMRLTENIEDRMLELPRDFEMCLDDLEKLIKWIGALYRYLWNP